ncbi:MAG: glutathione-disulfide reductase [Hyphomicrobiaceae bacterium]
MAEFDYDLFVIGAGSGGVRAARIAAGYGAKVAVAEEYRVGGTCVIRGCVPKKLLVYASRVPDEIEEAAGYGWTIGEGRFDWATLIANKDREIARLEAIYTRNLVNAGVAIYECRATLLGPNTIELTSDGRRITARHILIATGAHPNVDTTLPGVQHVITSNEFFHLPRLPERVVVAGGGYIAVELAGILNGLGSKVTILYRGEEILRGFDDDLRTGLHQAYEARGIRVLCGEVFRSVEKTANGLVGMTTGGHRLEADQILFAIGRNPNIRGLGLEAAGVAVDAEGAVVVDTYSQTSTPSVYAVGDVTNRANLTPVAIREGHAFADTVFGGKPTAVDHSLIPTGVFSTPEIGTVGLTEDQARRHLGAVDIYKTSFRAMKLTLTDKTEKMLMKLVVDPATDKVLGAHILGPDAAEMAQILGIPIGMGATKADFDRTMALHPSAAEELVTLRTKWQGG